THFVAYEFHVLLEVLDDRLDRVVDLRWPDDHGARLRSAELDARPEDQQYEERRHHQREEQHRAAEDLRCPLLEEREDAPDSSHRPRPAVAGFIGQPRPPTRGRPPRTMPDWRPPGVRRGRAGSAPP